MCKFATVGKYDVGIAQTYSGWNVSTFTVNGKKVKVYKSVNTRTLAEAQKEFTRQKRLLTGQEVRKRPTATKKPIKRKTFDMFGFKKNNSWF
jgi:hypothetical protein